MKKQFYTLIALLFFTNLLIAQYSQEDFNLDKPSDLKEYKKVSLWATQYYIHKFISGGTIPITYQDGKESGLYADTCDFCEASLEGTAYVSDTTGKVTIINFAKTGDKTFVDCRKCKKYKNSKLAVESWGKALWTESSGFGDGVKNFKLIPFRTIAVDNKKIPYGTVIYIPQAKGKIIELPDGTKITHDGYFFAGDTGGAIKLNHIDVFTGIYSGNPFSEIIKSNKNKTFEAFIVTNKEIIDYLTKMQSK